MIKECECPRDPYGTGPTYHYRECQEAPVDEQLIFLHEKVEELERELKLLRGKVFMK